MIIHVDIRCIQWFFFYHIFILRQVILVVACPKKAFIDFLVNDIPIYFYYSYYFHFTSNVCIHELVSVSNNLNKQRIS